MLDLTMALENVYDEVGYFDFYRDVFPMGSFQKSGEFEAGVYNGIAVSIGIGEKRTKRYTITDDLEVIDELAASNDFCIISPISYIGKERVSGNARFMYAMAIDLDGVETLEQWQFLLQQIDYGHEMLCFVWGLPRPTYLVSSGTGLHIYYVFERPIPLFSNVVKELEKLKKRLTWQAWTQGASSLHDNVQYESLFQGFRMVGSITKTGGRCRAFRVGDKVTVEYLNRYVPEEYRAEDMVYKSTLTLQQAKEKYPEWYEKRIVDEKPKGTWVCKRDLYDWWLRKLYEGAEQGHRYWCVMTLATYAKKCDIPREELEEDAFATIPFMNTKGDEFTEGDVLAALEAFKDSYITYPIHTIVARTGISIERNRRNYRKQDIHLRGARAIQQINDEVNGTSWRNKDGRPSAEAKVRVWREEHPDGRKVDCIRDTGLSKPTVLKWWDPAKKGYQCALAEKRKVPTANESPIEYGRPRVWTLGDGIPRKRMLPDAYVVDGDPDMLGRMMSYATKGIRSVEILTGDEYDEMAVNEHWRMFYRDRYKGVVFKESELEPWFMELVRDYGLQVKVTSEGDNDD